DLSEFDGFTAFEIGLLKTADLGFFKPRGLEVPDSCPTFALLGRPLRELGITGSCLALLWGKMEATGRAEARDGFLGIGLTTDFGFVLGESSTVGTPSSLGSIPSSLC